MSNPRILIVNIYGIGDVLFTTPLIRNIKRAWPHSYIGYLSNGRTAPVLRARPDVDSVIVYDRDEFHQAKQRSRAAFLQKWRGLLAAVREGKYTLAIDLSMSPSFSVMLALAGIPQRTGFNYKNRSPLMTKKIPLAGYERQHVMEYYLTLLTTLQIPVYERKMDFPFSAQDDEAAQDILKHRGFAHTRPLVAMFPGGGASWGKEAAFKRWPVERYARLADKIIANFNAAVILLGDSSEEDLCRSIAEVSPQRTLITAGRTSLTQTAALLSRMHLAVVNDGGPLHIAVAAGTPTVSIFGPVDEHVYGPPADGRHEVVTADVACRPCYRNFRRAQCEHLRCIQDIRVEDVFARVKIILERAVSTNPFTRSPERN